MACREQSRRNREEELHSWSITKKAMEVEIELKFEYIGWSKWKEGKMGTLCKFKKFDNRELQTIQRQYYNSFLS